jgi:hypothetical protein
MVALGGATPKAKTGPSTAGQSLIAGPLARAPLSLSWHPSELTIAVGRTGWVGGTYFVSEKGSAPFGLSFRTVRAIEFTTDGSINS